MSKSHFQEFADELGKSQAMRDASFELIRLWRMGWDAPGSSGHQSYVMAYRTFADLMMSVKGYSGSYIELAQAILATGKDNK
jgi:hypothetical protein